MLQIREFQRADFVTLLKWHQDPILNRELGPLDQEWLDAVLQERPPSQYTFTKASSIVAVAGVVRPLPDTTDWTISDVAVAPELKGQGIGRSAIELLVAHVGKLHGPNLSWVTYVDCENVEAQSFFRKIGWIQYAIDEHQMIPFRSPASIPKNENAHVE